MVRRPRSLRRHDRVEDRAFVGVGEHRLQGVEGDLLREAQPFELPAHAVPSPQPYQDEGPGRRPGRPAVVNDPRARQALDDPVNQHRRESRAN